MIKRYIDNYLCMSYDWTSLHNNTEEFKHAKAYPTHPDNLLLYKNFCVVVDHV